MQPIPEAVAWSLRAEAWAQNEDQAVERSSSGTVSRWSDVAATGRPAIPADGVGWRTSTSEWRATSDTARWRQTTEWRSASGTHGWRQTTEAWQSGDSENFRPPVDPPSSSLPAISGTAWPTPEIIDQSGTPPTSAASGWQQSATDAPPSWQQPSAPDTPSWQQRPADAAPNGQQRPVDTPSWQQTPADAPPSWQQTPADAPPSWQQRSADAPSWQQRPADAPPSRPRGDDRPSWQQFATPAAAPSWEASSPQPADAPRPRTDRPSWDSPPSWQQFTGSSRSEASRGDWQTDRAARSDAPSWQTDQPGNGRWQSPPDRPGESSPNRQNTQLPAEPVSYAGSWSDDGRHLVREDDRAQWRRESAAGRAGHRAAEPGSRTSGGTGWADRSDADNWAGHTDTGSIPRFPEPATDSWRTSSTTNGWQSAPATDSWRTADPSTDSWRSADEASGGAARPNGRRAVEPDDDGWSRGGQARTNGWQGGGTDERRGGDQTGDSTWRGDQTGNTWRSGDQAGGGWRSGGQAAGDGWRSGGQAAGDGWRGGDQGYGEDRRGDGRTDGAEARDGWRDAGSRRRDGETRPPADPWAQSAAETGVIPLPAQPREGDTGGWRSRTDTGSWQRDPDAGRDQRGDGRRSRADRTDTGSWQRGVESGPGSWQRDADGRDDRRSDPGSRARRRDLDAGEGRGDAGPAGRWRGTGESRRDEDDSTGSWRRDADGRDGGGPRLDADGWDGGARRRDADPGDGTGGWRRDADGTRGRRPRGPEAQREPRRGLDAQRGAGMPRREGAAAYARRREPDTSWQRELESGQWHRDPESDVWLRDSDTGQWHRAEVDDDEDDEDDRDDERPRRRSRRGGAPGGPLAIESGRRRDEESPRRGTADDDEDDAPRRQVGGRRRALEGPLQLSARSEAPASAPPAPGDDDRPVSAAPAARERDAGPSDEDPVSAPPADRRPGGGPGASRPVSARPAGRAEPGAWRAEAAGPGGWRAEAAGPGGWRAEAAGPGGWRAEAAQPGAWRAEAQAAARTDSWRSKLRAEQGGQDASGEGLTEARQAGPAATWRDQPARGGATYREGGSGDWRRELKAESDLADGESRRFGTNDFVPFRPPSTSGASASVKVPVANSASEGITEVIQRTGANWQNPPDTEWPPRGAVMASSAGTYERRPVRTFAAATSRQSDLLEPEEEFEEETGNPLAAVGYTVVWYGVPVVLFVLYMLVLNGNQRAHALGTLADAAPQFGLSLVLSMLVAVGLRWASGSWKAASVGLASAVMGGGLATVLTSAITGQSLS
ncbi:hypothetical protein [Couchioplanes azureus]|uniref:hypothetical protein n=1 Tax=Couchioplanes caeruleus TaxID=56438 RepID=UPI0016709B0A|nr:hypothetical protein [Couchioplanes caeruleus]